MKKIIFILSIIISTTSCKKEPIENQEFSETKETFDETLEYNKSLKPLIFEFTSTGCPGCGSWGKPTFVSLINEFSNDIIPVAVHIKYNDPMVTPSSNAIATNRYGDIYTPQIWVNDTNGVVINNNSISSQASISNLRNLIVTSNSSTLVFIDGKIIEKTNGKERVKTGIKVKNLDTTNNDYFLSCYLMQNGILYSQQGTNANPTTHNFVIIMDTGTFWGEKVIWNNDLFEITYSFEDNVLNSDHHYVVILWQKSNNRYAPLGGYKFE